MNIELLKETDHYIALAKPAGLLVHSTPGSGEEITLVNWLLENYGEVSTIGDDPSLRPGIVHRLDRETSGVMIVARSQQFFDYIKQQFKNRTIEKHYLALVCGSPSKEEGVIDRSIARVGIKRVVGTPRNKAKNAKEAITNWSIRNRYEDFTLLDVAPKTGRTNQIRVHLASINHPIACDPVYGGKAVLCPSGINRLFLHAHSISFSQLDEINITIEAPLPHDLSSTLNNLAKE